MTAFVTETGSTYEVDEERKLVRSSRSERSRELGTDWGHFPEGEWKEYRDVEISALKQLVIYWPGCACDPPCKNPATITSRIAAYAPPRHEGA